MKLKSVFPTAIAIASGLLILVGYFISGSQVLTDIRTTLLNWAIILAGVAVFVGIFNLLIVHTNKVRRKQKGSVYSAILIVMLVATFLLSVILKPDHKIVMDVFMTVQVPVEASLMALLTVTLTYASIRLLRRRLNLLSIVFLLTALTILLATAPLPFLGDVPILSDLVRPFLAQVFAAAGARGILIGVALGTLTTGLRILFGADRPYGGK